MSSAEEKLTYKNYLARLQGDFYTRNTATLRRNRNTLVKSRNHFTRRVGNGRSKNTKSNAEKAGKLHALVTKMNSLLDTHKDSKKVEAPVEGKVEHKRNSKMDLLVKQLQTDFFATMGALNKKQLEEVLTYLSDAYYNEGVSLISDEDYDRLVEQLKVKFGTNAANSIGIGAEVVKNKVKLPYFMGSMDKIKPDKNNLASWLTTYPGKVCISDKLDGISALYIKDGDKKVLYTRGDGRIGQDITHMLKYIQIGDIPGVSYCVVRGELIVSKENYDKVKEGKRGARQMVAGLANQKTLTPERIALMKLVDFVAYEVIVPESLKPTEQFALLDTRSTFKDADWMFTTTVSIESLSEILTKRKEESEYEIDGIIVAHDAVYPRMETNPEHAFAFKMSFADQQTVTQVLGVRWEASKDGYLKPTVNFEPVNIGGVIIQYATGFNAAFIHDKGLGPGAFIEIIRSGDVIPYIKDVKSASPGGPQMPSVPWHWNETHIDAIIDDAESNQDVQKRQLLYFAKTLEIGFMGEGNVAKLYTAGVHTVEDFIKVDAATLIKSKEFTAKGAEKIVAERETAFKKATMTMWAVGSGIFGRSVGTKRLEQALAVTPKDLSVTPDLVSKITALDGWSATSARAYVENLPTFKTFMTRIAITPKVATPPPAAAVDGKMKGMVVLFTGFHPKDLETYVKTQGGSLAETWSSKVNLLVIKDNTVDNEKTKKAAAAGVKILTAEEFRKLYEI